LLVIDMQNAYVREGEPAYVVEARGIVPNINRLAERFRSAGATVVWVMNTLGPGADCWLPYRHFRRAELLRKMVAALTPGKTGHELWPEMDRRPQDLIVEKIRYSAMIQGSSDLDERLRRAGIDTLVITGTLTNVCCESTARDAMMLNYEVAVISDATAAHSSEEHIASLGSLYAAFADVMSTAEVLALFSATE
jgi:ureidoacrylate peracid hydrolase